MQNELQLSFQNLPIRIELDAKGNPLFCAVDVCDVLGYANSRKAIKDHCREAGVTKRYVSYASGKKQADFIDEGNLYRLLIKSNKPEAARFESWVCDEVLPKVRKTGSYECKSSASILPKPPEPNRPALTDQSTRHYLCIYQGDVLQSQTLLTETVLVEHLREQYPTLEVVEKEVMVGNMCRLINELSAFAGQFTTYTESCSRFDRLMSA